VYSHKNTLGLMAAWGTAACGLMAARDRGRRRRAALLGALLSLTLVALSTSTTAAVVLMGTAVGTWTLFKILRQPPVLRAGLILWLCAFLLGGAAIAAPRYAAITESLGRDPTLTGRSNIWSDTEEAISHKKWLGYGYAAFWGGPDSPAREVWALEGVDIGRTDFKPMSAHNGWLNLAAQLGLVGVGVVAWLLAVCLRRMSRAVARSPQGAAGTALMFLVFFFFYNLAEGFIMLPNNFNWIMLVACIVQASGTWTSRRSAAPLASGGPERRGGTPR
jgi:O-antigen ligase